MKQRRERGTISEPISLRLSSGSKSTELCLLPFGSWSSAPSQVSGVSPPFSALPHSEAVTVSPAFYHSILLSLPAGDSAKCLAFSSFSVESGGGEGVGDTPPQGRGSSRGQSARVTGKAGFLTQRAGHAPWHQEHRGSQDRQQDPRDPGGSKWMDR